jgi:sulfur carrier protein ThiS
MHVFLNGQREEIRAQTVSDLITGLSLVPERILVEHSGTALLRKQWGTTFFPATIASRYSCAAGGWTRRGVGHGKIRRRVRLRRVL